MTGQTFTDANGVLLKTVDYNSDGSSDVSVYDASGDVTQTEALDGSGDLVSASGVSVGGVAFSESVSGAQASFTYGAAAVDWSDAAVAGGEALGSAIGRALGGNDLVLQIAGSTMVGTLSKDLAASLVDFSGPVVLQGTATAGGVLDSALGQSFGSFGVDLSGELQNAVDGDVSGLLMSELAHSLGLTGFGAGLFTSVGTTITAKLVSNALNAVTTGADAASVGDALFSGINIGSLSGSVGGFFGSYLAAELVPAQNTDGAIGGSVGSAQSVLFHDDARRRSPGVARNGARARSIRRRHEVRSRGGSPPNRRPILTAPSINALCA